MSSTFAEKFRNDIGDNRFNKIVYDNINKMMVETMFDIAKSTSSQDLLNEFHSKHLEQEGKDYHLFLMKFISLYMGKLADKEKENIDRK